MQYQLKRAIAGRGEEAGLFHTALRGIALDAEGRLYAAGDSEIKVFNTAGALLRRWSTSRPPLSVAVDPNGTSYVGENEQIEIFDSAGHLLRTWRNSEYLGRVTSIGFFSRGVLAGDATGACIRNLNPDGRFLNNVGTGNGRTGLLIPNGVVDLAIDDEETVHVPNPGRHRVERYLPTGELLGHMGHFSGPDPTGFSGVGNPTNVAIAGPNRLCVTERAMPRAKIYDYDGELLSVIESNRFDSNAKNMDVAVDDHARVYVADPVNLAIFVFALEAKI